MIEDPRCREVPPESGHSWRAGIVCASLVAVWGCGGSQTPTSPAGPITTLPSAAPLACGVERWPVKTLADADAGRINFVPVSSTIAILSGLPAHCGGGPDASRAYGEELQVYEVIGRITLVRAEDDRDYHIALADPNQPTSTMVTEVADPGCFGATGTLFAQQLLQDARVSFDAFRAGRSLTGLAGEMVRVRGVGFYDFNHGQTGRSRSCIELHPVLAIERAQF
jgi:hypothetical protein